MIINIFGEDNYRSYLYLQKMIEKFKAERDPQGYNVILVDNRSKVSEIENNWPANSLMVFSQKEDAKTNQKQIEREREKKKKLEQLATSLDENDNPVLMLVKLKE